jgi:hypothetical protein
MNRTLIRKLVALAEEAGATAEIEHRSKHVGIRVTQAGTSFFYPVPCRTGARTEVNSLVGLRRKMEGVEARKRL